MPRLLLPVEDFQGRLRYLGEALGAEYVKTKAVPVMLDPDGQPVKRNFVHVDDLVSAMLRALENGRQAALMAPTETLAEQHLLTLDRLLGGLVPIALLTGIVLAIGWIAFSKLRSAQREAPPPFEATLAELAQDMAALRGGHE